MDLGSLPWGHVDQFEEREDVLRERLQDAMG